MLRRKELECYIDTSNCPLLSISGQPVATASTFLQAILVRVYVKAAADAPSVQSLHLCFMVRIPLGKSTWSSRCLLDLKGNLNFYPRLIEILVWQREWSCQPNEEAWRGSLRKVEGSRGDGWGSAQSLSWLTLQFCAVGIFFFAISSQNFLKLFCCHT